MRSKLLIAGIMLSCTPFLASAQSQTTTTKTVTKNGKTKTKVTTTPTWGAAHQYHNDKYVYFPDYYTFYEPDRGYVYWNNGRWTTSTTTPSYLSSVDLNRARIQIIDDMTVRPETRYRTYMETYPAQKVEVTVPVPEVR